MYIFKYKFTISCYIIMIFLSLNFYVKGISVEKKSYEEDYKRDGGYNRNNMKQMGVSEENVGD